MIELQHLPAIFLGAYCDKQEQDFLFVVRTLQPEENVMKLENTGSIASNREFNPDHYLID
ncbi:hypothetical protein MIZ01_1912 [Sideroxyarcus emersonii]|uniref:Uncharacterized protein n=2 Tax=Sideroxyarcus emersonii TaxID=2764705 RepID=A0AAN1XBA7_9PROT|nr:hypothetical protein MIZ01_1912 [Sideroxyarcus emersonii]